MNPDLMHSSRPWPAKDDGCFSIKAEPLELRVAILAVGRHLADADLVAHHLDWLLARDGIPGKRPKIILFQFQTDQ